MKLCTETITVFNSHLDQTTGDIELLPTVITGVSWFDDVAATVDPSTGLKAASKVTVRIPENAETSGKTYADSKAYQSNPDGLFTLQPGDLLIKGIDTGSKTISELQKKHRVATVLAVTDNRRAPRAKHWKLVAA